MENIYVTEEDDEEEIKRRRRQFHLFKGFSPLSLFLLKEILFLYKIE